MSTSDISLSKGVFVHPQALIETSTVGDNSHIGAFTHILAGATIGRDCDISGHIFMENEVVVGDSVTIKSGVQLWNGVHLEDGVFIGANATFSNDPPPGDAPDPASHAAIRVCNRAIIGANATILPGVTIAEGAVVGAGAVVTRDVPRYAIVTGNPARITGYVQTGARPASVAGQAASAVTEPAALAVAGARLIKLPQITDLRGSLTFGEIGRHLPFEPKRFFVVHDVPSQEVRGEHAHKSLQQLLICLRGSCSVVVDDGENRQEVRLDSPQLGLHVSPGVWDVHYKYSEGAMLLSLCSSEYDSDDYIRDYDSFLEHVRSKK